MAVCYKNFSTNNHEDDRHLAKRTVRYFRFLPSFALCLCIFVFFFVSVYFCLCVSVVFFVFVFPFLISSIFLLGRELRLSLASLASLAMLGGACPHPAKCSLGETSTFQNDESIGSIQSIKNTESIESTKSTNRVVAVLAWEGQ